MLCKSAQSATSGLVEWLKNQQPIHFTNKIYPKLHMLVVLSTAPYAFLVPPYNNNFHVLKFLFRNRANSELET
jgi:hypothetical protein